MARALDLGNAEGLDAVSLRRLALDFGVTPMALYRHVRDKQDLVNAMTETVMEGLDLKVARAAALHRLGAEVGDRAVAQLGQRELPPETWSVVPEVRRVWGGGSSAGGQPR